MFTEDTEDPEDKAESCWFFRVFLVIRGQIARMSAIEDLQRTMARLRAPDGCPWDREQTHQTLARCLIDEVSELLDTIDRNDLPHMREELGDVLIQIVFHAQLAAERGEFTFEDVARGIDDKLIRRHPHVFGDHGKLGTADEVITKWEQIKAQEKKNGPVQNGLFKDMPPRLPALMLAEAVVKQIEKKSLPADGALNEARVVRLANELSEETAGRRLFELAAACRLRGLDPESALRKECDRVMHEVEKKVDANLAPK
jgi:MazG family protein